MFYTCVLATCKYTGMISKYYLPMFMWIPCAKQILDHVHLYHSVIKVLTKNSNANVKTRYLSASHTLISRESMAGIFSRIYFKGIWDTTMKLYNEISYKINPGPIARGL